jgi:hypothetical protein
MRSGSVLSVYSATSLLKDISRCKGSPNIGYLGFRLRAARAFPPPLSNKG